MFVSNVGAIADARMTGLNSLNSISSGMRNLTGNESIFQMKAMQNNEKNNMTRLITSNTTTKMLEKQEEQKRKQDDENIKRSFSTFEGIG